MGDGDCGTPLTDGSGAMMTPLSKGDINAASISLGMTAVANTIARSTGGTCGALYAVFFTVVSHPPSAANMVRAERQHSLA